MQSDQALSDALRAPCGELDEPAALVVCGTRNALRVL